MEIMQVIWKLDKPVTSTELLQIFEEQFDIKWKRQTISTFLTRLVDKEMLKSQQIGKGNIYTASITQKEYETKEARGLLDIMYKGRLKNFLTALNIENDLNTTEIEDLKKWINDI